MKNNTITCLRLVSAETDCSDDCQCFNDVENGDAVQALEKLITCMSSALDSYFPGGERPHYRKKKSADDVDDFWRSRDHRGGGGPVHLPSSFTPRLGRRDERKPVDTRSHLVNLHAGSPFTPRLGRRGKSYN